MIYFITDEKEQFIEKCEQSQKKENSVLRITKQKIVKLQGFGGCFNELGYIALSALSETDKKTVLDDLFGKDSCNFNYCRSSIAANDFATEWYSYDETPGDYELKNFSVARDEKTVIPYIKEGLKRREDMILFASPWSPPTWMKTNNNYSGGRLKKDKRTQKAHAKYLSMYLSEYKKRGIHINYLYPQNEVMANLNHPTCLWTGEEYKTFIQKYLMKEIEKEHPDVKIWLGTINSESFEDYAFRFLEDKKLRNKIGGVGYQWAGKEAIQKTHESFPNAHIIQTESECGDGNNTFAFAEYIFSLMQLYLTNGAEAYVYWNMVLGSNPTSPWGWRQNSLITVDEETKTWRKNPEYYLMKHFSKFMERGDTVVRTIGGWTGNAVAVQKQDGSHVIVVHNPLQEERTIRIVCDKKEVKVDLRPNAFHTILL